MSSDTKVRPDEAARRMNAMDDQILSRIAGHEKLVETFGQWPSFHDMEVVSLRLDRDQGEALTSPMATFSIHVFNLKGVRKGSGQKGVSHNYLFFSISFLRKGVERGSVPQKGVGPA